MEILAGIENGIIASICYNNIAHIAQLSSLTRGRRHNVSIPHSELLHYRVEGDVDTPADGGAGEPVVAEVELPHVPLGGGAVIVPVGKGRDIVFCILFTLTGLFTWCVFTILSGTAHLIPIM